jgi:hypothetical protein
MITESEFTAAMERAVEKRGRAWRYPMPINPPGGYYINAGSSGMSPSYSDREGNGTCLIGVAIQELTGTAPDHAEQRSAWNLLVGIVKSEAVAGAARCAQIHQDKFETWGECLDVYKAALALFKQSGDRVFPWAVSAVYHQAVKVARGEVAVDVPVVVDPLQSIIDGLKTLTESIVASHEQIKELTAIPAFVPESQTFPKITITVPYVSPFTGKAFANGGICSPPTSLLAKKDHALVA